VDIAAFLDAKEAFVFDDSYRPVPLTTHVAVCGDAGANQFLFNKSMNHKVPGVIRQFSKGKPYDHILPHEEGVRNVGVGSL
jgi:hypothetical protein